jgi:hypothetical protein
MTEPHNDEKEPTPRTDDLAKELPPYKGKWVEAEDCAELERELAEAKKWEEVSDKQQRYIAQLEDEKEDRAALSATLTTGASKMEVTDKMVDRFLSWPMPFSVCADLCATKQGPGRVGTNLLTADQARQMLEHVLAGAPDGLPETPLSNA